MTTEHLIEALRATAREYAELPDGQLIAQALRGVVARAQRYEAQEPATLAPASICICSIQLQSSELEDGTCIVCGEKRAH